MVTIGMMRQTPPDERPQAIAERLRLTRATTGLSQADFAARAGLSPSTYNQYENGKQFPRISFAIALCETYHLTLDWIYRGDISGLRYEMAAAIKALRTARNGNP